MLIKRQLRDNNLTFIPLNFHNPFVDALLSICSFSHNLFLLLAYVDRLLSTSVARFFIVLERKRDILLERNI